MKAIAIGGMVLYGYMQNGKLVRHSFDELPAVEHASGTKEWWINGVFKRIEY